MTEEEVILSLAYVVVILALAIIVVAMWKAGKEGDEE